MTILPPIRKTAAQLLKERARAYRQAVMAAGGKITLEDARLEVERAMEKAKKALGENPSPARKGKKR